jgi:hypothetical protein
VVGVGAVCEYQSAFEHGGRKIGLILKAFDPHSLVCFFM